MNKVIFRRLLWRAALGCLCILLFGCAALTRNYGTFVPDDSVTRHFESFQMDPDMNYYFSGSSSYPNAIMGLKKEYVLDNDLWRPVKPDPKVFHDLIEGMLFKTGETGVFLHGFVMRAPNGKAIGVWYSLLSVQMKVKMGEGNKVIVYTPEQHVYHQDEGDDEGGTAVP